VEKFPLAHLAVDLPFFLLNFLGQDGWSINETVMMARHVNLAAPAPKKVVLFPPAFGWKRAMPALRRGALRCRRFPVVASQSTRPQSSANN